MLSQSSELELIERGEMDLQYRDAMEIRNNLMEAIECVPTRAPAQTQT